MPDCRIMANILVLCVIAVILIAISPAFALGVDFLEAKTVFQTNTAYDERIALAVDGVIVHRHGTNFVPAMQSWHDKGFTVGRMFFADSDAANAYWTGKWDGTEHAQDVERDREGNVVKCSGVRPYMLPTEGWIRYLEEMTDASLAAGAAAVLPEEPLAHVFTGYEGSFAELWQARYGKPWQPQHESARAQFLTAQLKNELYIKLEERLMKRTLQFENTSGKETAFVLPIHSLYSNIAAQLVAPLGTSTGLDGIDGYIGQIWTGPVNWALGCYDSPRKEFFTSAYVLYDYFTQLTVETDKKLWLLVDPVEDNPNHKWSEFEQWYKHCIAAMLLAKDVDSYEIMPWPDRIFLPGYGTGGGTPAPEDYRITILAVTQALQEIPLGGKWLAHSASDPGASPPVSAGIGVAIADTLMWQGLDHPRLQGVYSLLLPLVERGIPVSSFILERLADKAYMSRFAVVVLSYESFKPTDPAMNVSLAEWVKAGGSLIILGSDADELDQTKDFWWHSLGFKSPLSHLRAQLKDEGKAAWDFGNGHVSRSEISPKAFADPAEVERTYLPLLDSALKRAGRQSLKTPRAFLMRRGPFIIAHATAANLDIPGKLIDIFDPELRLHENARLTLGQSGLYRDVAEIIERGEPALLHTTHRLISQQYKDGRLTFAIRGPAKTPAVARLFLPKTQSPKITTADADGKTVNIEMQRDADTIRLKFPNHPKGVTVEIE